VLLVDDEPLVARIVTRVLEGHAEVVVVGDAAGALRLLRDDDRFDLVICDLMLPTTSGAALYRTLAEERPSLAERLVVVTGGAITAEAQEFVRRMGDRVLLKPFKPEQLRALVRRFAPAAG
jgi:CheY-like chemotaxis protein